METTITKYTITVRYHTSEALVYTDYNKSAHYVFSLYKEEHLTKTLASNKRKMTRSMSTEEERRGKRIRRVVPPTGEGEKRGC